MKVKVVQRPKVLKRAQNLLEQPVPPLHVVRQNYLRLQVLARLQPLQPLVRKLIVRLNVQRLKHLRKPLTPADFERRAQRRPKKVEPVLQVLPAVRLRKQPL